MQVVYLRVSTTERNPDRQPKALEEAGIEKILHEKQSGKNTARPQLRAMLDFEE